MLEGPANDLHVLPRHRLLLQSHGFEGLIPTRKYANLAECAVAEPRNHESESLPDLGTRVLYPSGHVNARDNSILRVAGLVDLKAEVIEVLGKSRFDLSHAVMSTVGGAVQPAISRVPDNIGREERERGADSFRTKGLEGVSHDLHVLLRHRLPPFLGEAFSGSTGLVDVAVRRLGHRRMSIPRAGRRPITTGRATFDPLLPK